MNRLALERFYAGEDTEEKPCRKCGAVVGLFAGSILTQLPISNDKAEIHITECASCKAIELHLFTDRGDRA